MSASSASFTEYLVCLRGADNLLRVYRYRTDNGNPPRSVYLDDVKGHVFYCKQSISDPNLIFVQDVNTDNDYTRILACFIPPFLPGGAFPSPIFQLSVTTPYDSDLPAVQLDPIPREVFFNMYIQMQAYEYSLLHFANRKIGTAPGVFEPFAPQQQEAQELRRMNQGLQLDLMRAREEVRAANETAQDAMKLVLLRRQESLMERAKHRAKQREIASMQNRGGVAAPSELGKMLSSRRPPNTGNVKGPPPAKPPAAEAKSAPAAAKTTTAPTYLPGKEIQEFNKIAGALKGRTGFYGSDVTDETVKAMHTFLLGTNEIYIRNPTLINDLARRIETVFTQFSFAECLACFACLGAYDIPQSIALIIDGALLGKFFDLFPSAPSDAVAQIPPSIWNNIEYQIEEYSEALNFSDLELAMFDRLTTDRSDALAAAREAAAVAREAAAAVLPPAAAAAAPPPAKPMLLSKPPRGKPRNKKAEPSVKDREDEAAFLAEAMAAAAQPAAAQLVAPPSVDLSQVMNNRLSPRNIKQFLVDLRKMKEPQLKELLRQETAEGQNFLMLALKQPYSATVVEIIRILLRSIGSDICKADNSGKTVLHYWAERSARELETEARANDQIFPDLFEKYYEHFIKPPKVSYEAAIKSLQDENGDTFVHKLLENVADMTIVQSILEAIIKYDSDREDGPLGITSFLLFARNKTGVSVYSKVEEKLRSGFKHESENYKQCRDLLDTINKQFALANAKLFRRSKGFLDCFSGARDFFNLNNSNNLIYELLLGVYPHKEPDSRENRYTVAPLVDIITSREALRNHVTLHDRYQVFGDDDIIPTLLYAMREKGPDITRELLHHWAVLDKEPTLPHLKHDLFAKIRKLILYGSEVALMDQKDQEQFVRQQEEFVSAGKHKPYVDLMQMILSHSLDDSMSLSDVMDHGSKQQAATFTIEAVDMYMKVTTPVELAFALGSVEKFSANCYFAMADQHGNTLLHDVFAAINHILTNIAADDLDVALLRVGDVLNCVLKSYVEQRTVAGKTPQEIHAEIKGLFAAVNTAQPEPKQPLQIITNEQSRDKISKIENLAPYLPSQAAARSSSRPSPAGN